MHMQDFTGKRVGRFLLSSLLGSGAAGTVYRAIDTSKEDSPTFAMKCIPKSRSAGRLRQQIAEIDNHSTVAWCPNILKLYEIFDSQGHFFLVLPLCEMDLFRAIWKEKVFWRNDGLIKKAFVQILDGVSACHNKSVFHRDLKPENIMCNMDGTGIAIGDFGMSIDRRVCRDGRCGTNSYMSPECWDDEGIFYYAKPLDVWSLGVVLFNMVTCRYPWEEARTTDEEFASFVSEKDYLLHTYAISGSLSALLHQIWHPTPMRRISIPTIRRAILEMDTFYELPHSTCYTPSPLSVELVDSQRTCVAPVEDERKKGSWVPTDGQKKSLLQ